MSTNEDFEGIYKQYRRFSIRLAFKIVHNEETAKDVCQDVFTQLFRMGDRLKLEKEEKVRALIVVSTVNRAKDYMKSAYARNIDGSEMDPEHPGKAFAPDLDAVILNMEENQYRKMVLMRYRNINPMNYEILVKVKYLEIPTDIVAEQYGLTRNNVNNRILRARLWLEKELQKLYK